MSMKQWKNAFGLKKEAVDSQKKVCWNKHTVLLQNKAESNVKNIQSHNYKDTFKRVSNMMIHKKNKHPEKVRLCRNGE